MACTDCDKIIDALRKAAETNVEAARRYCTHAERELEIRGTMRRWLIESGMGINAADRLIQVTAAVV